MYFIKKSHYVNQKKKMHSANDNKDLFITKFWYSGEHRPREKLKSPLTKLKKNLFEGKQ